MTSHNFEDMTGHTIAGCAVLQRVANRLNGNARWLVRAACGCEDTVEGQKLRAYARAKQVWRCPLHRKSSHGGLSEEAEIVLQILADGPKTAAELEALQMVNSDRSLRAILACLVGNRYLSLASDGTYTVIPKELREGAPGSRVYARAVEAWLTLADGTPHAVADLFKPSGAKHRLCQLLLKSGLCELTPERDAIFVARRERFKNIWGDEALFCKFFGWPTSHAADVNALLADQELTVQEQADIATRLAPIIGKNNLSRRSGRWNHDQVATLLKFNALPAAVRAHPGLKLRLARTLVGMTDEQKMLDWLNERTLATGRAEEIVERALDPLYEPPPVEPEPGAQEMLATALKLSAATFDMVSSIERKISWIAKELGWEEQQ